MVSSILIEAATRNLTWTENLLNNDRGIQITAVPINVHPHMCKHIVFYPLVVQICLHEQEHEKAKKKICKSRATATPIAERLVMFEHPAVMDTTPASIPLQSPPTSYLNGKQIWQGWHWYQMQVFDWQQLHGLLSPTCFK